MTRDDWVRVKDIVSAALSHADAARSAYLDAQCRSHPRLRSEVESLLAASLRAADLFENPSLLVNGVQITLEALGEVAPISSTSLGRASSGADSPPEAHFSGTSRYGVRRQIGAGGMGIVYEVEDRTRQQIVALKTLRRWQAADIFRLKQEFRALAGIAHPNLVSLYDLVVDDERCFFTMELIHGVTFVDDARSRPSSAVDVDRIRHTLPQLIQGVQELHRRGKLHRDIKPSNVLVTRDGRVVVLDFGLTSGRVSEDSTAPRDLAGTPAYLAPEQCSGLEPSEASDWYGVAVTLYQSLTGRLPFEGSLPDLVRQKTTTAVARPSVVAPEVPEDLDDVCVAMLARDPRIRLTGQEALDRLSDASSPDPRSRTIPDAAFIGRENYLEVLSAAFAALKEGRGACVSIHGPSGIGKSALVHELLERRLRGETFIALRGRCHEHESVPYKGLDGVIDSLSRYLGTQPGHEVAELIPRDAVALARLFPVMQIEPVLGPVPVQPEVADPVALRRSAFVALRELLGRLAVRRPLVIAIDDFQWADADSAIALTELLRPPNAPALLLLISFRSEEMEAKPFLRALIDRVDFGTKIAMPLAPMSDDEAGRLVESLLPSNGHPNRGARDIAREAAGNPFLIEELSRYVALGARPDTEPTLEEMLKRRLDSLPHESRAFLETLAVCGRPIMPARIFEACGLTGDERPLVARLRSSHFLRSSRSADHVEMYHDKIRETLAAEVPGEAARRIHELMAQILVAHGDDDPEALYEHYRAAAHDALAATQAALAAGRATTVLAFDRAAALYRHALELQPHASDRGLWTIGLARALENAGRPAEAADVYLLAAAAANDRQRIELLRKAAELLLNGGHIDRGLEIVNRVLKALGMRLDRRPATALASILLRRAQLAWRGLEFEERDESRIAEEDLLRIDTCWSITTGLALVDNIRAASFHIRQLLIALDTGEPYRVARALALEAGFAAVGGGKAAQERSAELSTRAQAMAERLGHPHARALSSLTVGVASFLLGKWVASTEHCERALRILRDECTGVLWEMNLAHDFFLGSLLFRGEIRDVSHWLPGLLQTTRLRGNLYFETELRTRMNLVWLAADDADGGERQANDAIARWSDSGFHRQHYNHYLARVQTELYRGRGQAAWQLVVDHEAPIRRNMWLRVQFIRIETAFQRARCALALAASGHDLRHMRAVAAREASRLERENTMWSNAIARLVRGTLAHLDGDDDAAVSRLNGAVEAFTAADMKLYVAVIRRRLAAIVGGDAGRALQRQADEWMAAQEIRNPAAISRLVAPGFRE